MLTYAGALAACVGRWGAQASTYRCADPGLYALDRWDIGDGCVWLCRTRTGRITITSARPYDTGVPMQEWSLTGPDATPLPGVIDAAVRWMAEHNDSTKGP